MSDRTGAVHALASVLPTTATTDARGHLQIGGCDVPALVAEFGTPLYVYDETTIRSACREFRVQFDRVLPGADVQYAAKAYLSPTIAAIAAQEGLGLDVVSGGELFVARHAGFPMARIVFHGNNKSEAELREALDAGVGRIVIDNFHELALLDQISQQRGRPQPVLLRVTPGVDAHTHEKTTTGIADSKFGFPLAPGDAEEAVRRTLAADGLELRGYHVHLGSPIFSTEPYSRGIQVMASFAARMWDAFEFHWREFSVGGGFAVAYTPDQVPPAVADYAQAVSRTLHAACTTHDLPVPRVHLEPGRSIVARAGVAVYTVGARKAIEGVRTYISVDGGMADNVRPAMYGSRYVALAANRMHDAVEETVAVAGKFCESGDILVREAGLPRLHAGDLLALPASGAYHLAMESNYNLATRPAVVFVGQGRARLARRRQSYDGLLALEEDATQVGRT